MADYPELLHTVLDTTRARELAEFYRELLGLQYRPGDEPPADRGSDDGSDDADWLVLVDSRGTRKLAFQQVDHLPRTTWPKHDVPMQLHVDFTVSSTAELQRQRERAEGSVPSCCSTAPTIPRSRCTSSRTPPAIRSASSLPRLPRLPRPVHRPGSAGSP